jgi:hypothetical protein
VCRNFTCEVPDRPHADGIMVLQGRLLNCELWPSVRSGRRSRPSTLVIHYEVACDPRDSHLTCLHEHFQRYQ